MPREHAALPVLEAPPPLVERHESAESREAVLARAGWSRRFVAAPPRLDEMTALYSSLGYEILLEPMGREELRPECGDCPAALVLARVVYTRRPK
jgi:hypothetical protein